MKPSSRLSLRIKQLVALATLALLWEIASRCGILNPLFFPPPSVIGAKLLALLGGEARFWSHLEASLRRLAVGSLVAVPSGVFCGILCEIVPALGLVMRPLVALSYPMPKIAIFPLLLVIFGIGEAPKVAMIAIGTFFLVMLSTLHGVRRLFDQGYMDLVRVYRIPFSRMLTQVILKGALPDILNGIKLGASYGLVMVVASEFTMSNEGIGVFIWNAWDQFRIPEIYCGIIVLGAIGLGIFSGIERIQSSLVAFKARDI